MKVLSNILINIKDLEEIEMSKCSLDQEKCKILADALMRMKKLKIFRMNAQKGLGQGLSSIVYNLAFNPNLVLLDLGEITIEANKSAVNNINETVVSLYKMLKISASIEILKLNKVPNLNNALTKEFWMALGECKSLRVLDLSNSGDLSNKIKDLGSSVAFNAKKKGSLSFLNLTGTISNQVALTNLYWGMCVSEYDEEQWYGDPNKVAKMIAGNYNKVFYNNLCALQLNVCGNLNPAFVLSHYNKLVNKKEPEYVKILADSPRLNTLHVQSTGLQKNMADILVLALDERREKLKCQLKVLDLSKNNLDKEGAKVLASILPFNNVLEVLDLSKNKMGVSGAD
jgi:Ran GTPase-activating protein (RanGAP) involved in mRNA processing and transport